MADFPPPTWPLTAATAERCLDMLAEIMADDPDGGEVYLPIWRRLERERDERRERERVLQTAHSRPLSGLGRLAARV